MMDETSKRMTVWYGFRCLLDYYYYDDDDDDGGGGGDDD